ncbi:response regulator transcription factor [Bifidobacterium criceti]|uniref:Two component transcriptional regulator, LuxR family n=1 Tax=Bifidobacterium criceti TaxID=1960969 RepID=A0A2A2EF83_9BIFI|nr:response regulator transcription factor [Bifidobacterium criceti]PAU67602.1 two component transcriptional regulator, LuxR family [Bifidobacterium criceti]
MQFIIVDNDPRAADSIAGFIRSAYPQAIIHQLRGTEPNIVMEFGAADLIVMDMQLFEESGPELCTKLRRTNGRTPVLGMTCFPKAYYDERFKEAGGQGLVHKEELGTLLTMIDRLLRGGAEPGYLTPDAARRAVLARDVQPDATADDGTPEALTPTERTVYRLMGEYGNDPIQIAAQIGVKPSTVRTHIRAIRHKLNLPTTKDLMRLLLRRRNR